MCSLLVGVLLIAALNTVGARLRHQGRLSDRERAVLLGQQLLAEILENDYRDPDETPVFGSEGSESVGSRALFDDVDDYHDWDASPPESRGGTALADGSGWRRTVVVDYVMENNLLATSAADEGFKRITVEVYRNGDRLAATSTVRSSAWEFAP